MKAESLLTIDPAMRLRHEVEILKVEKSKVDEALSRIDILYQKMGLT